MKTSAAKKRKSWQEKLADSKGLPKVETIAERMTKNWGSGTMVVPAPLEVDALMRQIPQGKVATINELRAALARKHRVNIACPLTTGIFAWIAAHAAEEAAAAAGNEQRTPWWRTLKAGGMLNPKYPGGGETQAQLLAAEGHRLLPAQGKRPPRVADYEKALYAELK